VPAAVRFLVAATAALGPFLWAVANCAAEQPSQAIAGSGRVEERPITRLPSVAPVPPPHEIPAPAPLAVEEPAPVAAEQVEAVHPDPPEVTYWYQPAYWLPSKLWDASFEVGINGSEGNSEALSSRVGGTAARKTERYEFELDAIHNRAKTGGLETQNNALGTARLDWLLGDSPWTLFAIGTIEYDEFRAFDLRLAGNGGVGYQFIKNDFTKLAGRFGSGVSKEIDSADDDLKPEAVLGMDLSHKLTAKQSLQLKVDYYPDWSDFTDYRLQADFGWEVLLDEASNLSLKLGVLDRYDSTPGPRRPNDVNYSLLLLWKL